MSTYEGPVGTCALCGKLIALDSIRKHLAVVHDRGEDFEEWPDGELVVVDETLEPSDFGEEQR